MIKEKIDRNLLNIVQMLQENSSVECIVRAYDYSRLEKILHNRNIKILNQYPFINSFRIKVDTNQLKTISNFSQVKFISSVSKASVLMNVAKKILGVADSELNGNGTTVAFIDTGITKHSDFVLGKNRIIYFKDFVNNKTKSYDDRSWC